MATRGPHHLNEAMSISFKYHCITRISATYHKQAIVAQRVAGYGGDVVVMVQDAAAVALPPSVTARQAEVPAGGHGV